MSAAAPLPGLPVRSSSRSRRRDRLGRPCDTHGAREQQEGFSDLVVAVTVYPAGSDLLIPTNVPTYQTLANVTQTGASFTWIPATDNKGVAGYNIYSQSPPTNCGRGVGCSGGPIVKAGVAGPDASYTITGLSPGTAYAIWFEPFDAAGNVANTRMGQVLPLLRFSTLP